MSINDSPSSTPTDARGAGDQVAASVQAPGAYPDDAVPTGDTAVPFLQPQAGSVVINPGADAVSATSLPGQRQGKFKTNMIVIEQEVDVPDVDWARNGTRKGASRTATRLSNLPQVALDNDACALLADSILDLPRITDLTRDDYLTPVRVAGLVIGQSVGRLLGGGLSSLPVVNPRGGHVSRVPVKPVTSCFDSTGRMLAQAERTIESFDVLRAAVLETVKNTLLLGGNYQESIVASGVMDPVLLRPTRTTLAAENVSFMALENPDGTTRSVTDVSVLFNTTDPDKITDAILTAHFGAAAVANGLQVHTGTDTLDISEFVRENLRKAHRDVVNTYWAKAADPELGADHPDTLRLQQALSIPATISLTVESKSPLARSYVEALGVLVRNTHINRANWVGAAEASDLAASVVATLVAQGLLSDADQDLLVAATPQACERALLPYGYNLGTDAAPLWRAVMILAIFSRPDVRFAAKQPLREALSLERILQQRYAAVVATLLDLPWRDSKSRSAKQAYNAWQRNGALVRDMWEGPAWTPVFADPSALVSQTGRDATMTLTAAGGVALIADRFLTSDAIAGVGDAGAVTMPYKVPTIDKLIGYLARSTNQLGREQLALAAKTFRADGESSSPWRLGERKERKQSLDVLRVANAKAIAQGRHDKVVPEPVYYMTPAATGGELDAQKVMVIADHDNALTAAHQGKQPTRPTTGNTGPAPKKLTPAELITDGRDGLLAALSGVNTQLADLSALAGQHGLGALDGQTYADALQAALNILTVVNGMKPVVQDAMLVEDDSNAATDLEQDADIDVVSEDLEGTVEDVIDIDGADNDDLHGAEVDGLDESGTDVA